MEAGFQLGAVGEVDERQPPASLHMPEGVPIEVDEAVVRRFGRFIADIFGLWAIHARLGRKIAPHFRPEKCGERSGADMAGPILVVLKADLQRHGPAAHVVVDAPLLRLATDQADNSDDTKPPRAGRGEGG